MLEHERARGAQYAFLVRSRFDMSYPVALPPLGALLSHPSRGKIMACLWQDAAARRKYAAGATSNPFGTELIDHFAVVPRKWARASSIRVRAMARK